MMKLPPKACKNLPTKAEKFWEYDEYYTGEKDDKDRKTGRGENCWSGAKSLESYNGRLQANTMHGVGFYRWRYYDCPGTFYTYEGHFYVNKKHGYGTTSFPDGRVFDGLFINDIRWGPGVESFPYLSENVGLWRGAQLVRLTWRPEGFSPVPDFLSVPLGTLAVQKYRKVLRENIKQVVVSSAQELLKQFGCDPIKICKVWSKLYPVHCTDLNSELCKVDAFEKDYHGNGLLRTLEEIQMNEALSSLNSSIDEEIEGEDKVNTLTNIEKQNFYAWNESELTLHMMKECYKYQYQKKPIGFNIPNILNGPRSLFKPAGRHEKNSRSLLMSCYLGDIKTVTRLINEFCIHQDVTDSLGNNPVMFATCGDQTTIIHFLVQASASVDYPNDSCCTPLGVALLRFACSCSGVAPDAALQALLPPPIPTSPIEDISDWMITRGASNSPIQSVLPRLSIDRKNKTEHNEKHLSLSSNNFREDITDNYENIKFDYDSKVSELMQMISTAFVIPYIYNFYDMRNDVVSAEEVVNKKAVSSASKTPKREKLKPTKVTDEDLNLHEEQATHLQDTIRSTISQLLCDGANPNAVKFPQPALVSAIASGNADLVRDLISHGANINETYSEIFHYTALDLAISQKLTSERVDVIQALLESGADCNHRLYYTQYDPILGTEIQIPGPNLLHVVLGRKIETEDTDQEEKRIQLLDLLLDYRCDPLTQFNGQAPLDLAMTKPKNLLYAFIMNTNTNLNGVINEFNQTVLVKMFSLAYFKSIESGDRLQILADLVLHGADPLIKCQNDEDEFENILVFIDYILSTLKGKKSVESLVGNEKKQDKGKKAGKNKNGEKDTKNDKNKKNEKIQTEIDKKNDKNKKPEKGKNVEKGKGKNKLADRSKLTLKVKQITLPTDDLRDYKLAQEMVKEYARMLHIRWLQTKLMAEIAKIVYTYKHRCWNIIVKEHENKTAVSLWLRPERCLEIWDILSTTNNKYFTDYLVLKYVLYIVQFYQIAATLHQIRSPCMTVFEKEQVESYINMVLREYRQQKDKDIFRDLKKSYALPELALNEEKNYNVCFECSLPLTEEKVLCENCNVVSFCDKKCLFKNIERLECHPCNGFLKMKYFLRFGEE